jgi:hypothetical protein
MNSLNTQAQTWTQAETLAQTYGHGHGHGQGHEYWRGHQIKSNPFIAMTINPSPDKL